MEKLAIPPLRMTVTLDERHLEAAIKEYLGRHGYDASMAGVAFIRTAGDRPGDFDKYGAVVTDVATKGGAA